jgi:CheY-like chemotaxis protein
VFSGEEALTIFNGGTSTYRVLVTDVRLGGNVSGWEVARRIRGREPAFPVIYVSARIRIGITGHPEQYPDVEALRGGTVGDCGRKSPVTLGSRGATALAIVICQPAPM